MLIEHIDFEHENKESQVSRQRRPRASVWDYFEKILGDDGLPKQRCTKCGKVYNGAQNSGTSTMRRHLRKCAPQPTTWFIPNVFPLTEIAGSSDNPPNEVRAAKRLKSVMEENLQMKSNRELQEFIWGTKRNIPLLEEKLPDKAVKIKETLKCYEDELDRRGKLRLYKENSSGCGTSIRAVKTESDDQHVAWNEFGRNMARDGSVVVSETTKTETHADVNQKISSQSETQIAIIKVEMEDQSVAGNENFDGNITEEEGAGRLQIVERHEDDNQAFDQQSTVSIIPDDKCTELRKISSLLSMITSPHAFYAPQNNPLDPQSENARKTLIHLLNKDFQTIVGSPDEQTLKSCTQILSKNLHKLPRPQCHVIETLHSQFESTSRNYATWRSNVDASIAFEVQKGAEMEALREWKEKDAEIEWRIAEVDADIVRLKAELREKEWAREGLVKEKSVLFEESKMSIGEAKRLVEEMVCVKVKSDVALDNIKDVASKWETMRKTFFSSGSTT